MKLNCDKLFGNYLKAGDIKVKSYFTVHTISVQKHLLHETLVLETLVNIICDFEKSLNPHLHNYL